jgi:prevent-host-death family protein
MRQIPQRELRNDIGRVLREVEEGARIRITVGGRPVADLVPIGDARRTFVPREALLRVLERAALDDHFAADVDAAMGATIDEL